jgi:hypothetical protein
MTKQERIIFLQAYILEALRKYKIDCINRGEKIDDEFANMFIEIVRDVGNDRENKFTS